MATTTLPTTFTTPAGEFSYAAITPDMRRMLESVNDHGQMVYVPTALGDLVAFGLARTEGLDIRITHSGWNVLPYL